jgi:hypothetical protein
VIDKVELQKPPKGSTLQLKAYCTQEYLNHISEEISRRGWFLQGVWADIEFVYTIGNHQVGLPELLMVGCNPILATYFLNLVVETMRRNNRPFEAGELIDWERKFPLKSVNVSDELKKSTFFDDYTLDDFAELIDCKRKFPFKSVNASDDAKEYTVFVGDYYGTNDYAVQQILIPYTTGQYPGDPEFEMPDCSAPVLTRQH